MSRVLLVEDDRDIRELTGLFLQGEGHQVLVAANGEEALALLRSGARPDVMVLDLMMPVMNGWTLREHMIRDPATASIPTIVITGDTQAARRSTNLHAVAVLTKPFEPDALLAVVAAIGAGPP